MRSAITGAAGARRDLGVELVPGDLDDPAALDRLCAGAAGLFDVAGWDKPGQRDARRPGNVEDTRNVLDAARRNQVPKVVYTSTLAVNSDTEDQAVDATYRVTGEHRSAYDRTTAETHDVARRRLPLRCASRGSRLDPGTPPTRMRPGQQHPDDRARRKARHPLR